MRKITLIALAAATVLGALASPSLAQVRGNDRGNDNRGGIGGGSGRGEYLTHVPAKRKPLILIKGKSGAYCSTNMLVLYNDNGERTKVRHCNERNHIEID